MLRRWEEADYRGKPSHIAYHTPIYNYIHDVADITYNTNIYEIALEMHTYIHTNILLHMNSLARKYTVLHMNYIHSIAYI